jgi:hypothetical protein
MILDPLKKLLKNFDIDFQTLPAKNHISFQFIIQVEKNMVVLFDKAEKE